MPSGFNDTVADAVLDDIAGASANSAILGGANIYLHAYTTAPSDDGDSLSARVDWGQGALSVAVVDGTNWPAASGRVKTSAAFTVGTNTSGSPITIVALGWEDTLAPGGTYLGGGPVDGGTFDVADGSPYVVTATLNAPSPS